MKPADDATLNLECSRIIYNTKNMDLSDLLPRFSETLPSVAVAIDDYFFCAKLFPRRFKFIGKCPHYDSNLKLLMIVITRGIVEPRPWIQTLRPCSRKLIILGHCWSLSSGVM